MTSADYLALAALTGYVVLVVWFVFAGDRQETCRLECPVLHRVVRCRIAHDVRTGRWLRVESCSALTIPDATCGQDCVRLTNQGLLRTCASARA